MDHRASRIFLLALAAAALFIFRTSAQLPPLVASHFGPAGNPTAWMAREQYRNLMLAVGVLLPLLVSYGPLWLIRRSPGLVNLPNRDYWFAPERAEESMQYLSGHLLRLGTMLTMFMGAMHYIVMRAQAAQPPRLPTVPFVTVLVAFIGVTLLLAISMLRRFSRRP